MEVQEYEEETKHRSYHGREYHNHQHNLNYMEKRGGGGKSGGRGGACGEVGGCYGGEEYKNGEAYNGFENSEGEFDGSNFEDNTDLVHCLYQEKEEKVKMMMVSKFMMII